MKISISLQYPFGAQSHRQFLRAFQVLALPAQNDTLKLGSDSCGIWIAESPETLSAFLDLDVFYSHPDENADEELFWSNFYEAVNGSLASNSGVEHFDFDWKESLLSCHSDEIKQLEHWGIEVQQGPFPNQWLVSRHDNLHIPFTQRSEFKTQEKFEAFLKELLFVCVEKEQSSGYQYFKEQLRKQSNQAEFLHLLTHEKQRSQNTTPILFSEDLKILREEYTQDKTVSSDAAWNRIFDLIQKTQIADPDVLLDRILLLLRNDPEKNQLAQKLLMGVSYRNGAFAFSKKSIFNPKKHLKRTAQNKAIELFNGIVLVLLGQLSAEERCAALQLDHDLVDLKLHGIKFVPPELGCFEQLETLELRREATSVAAELLSQRNQQYRYRPDSWILPAEIGCLHKLKTLSVRQSAITHLPSSLTQLKLEHLDLRDTNLRYIHHLVKDLEHLKSLCLPPRFPNHMEGHKLHQLETLSFEGTQIKTIPKWVSVLPRLKTLNLYGCQLKKFPQWAAQLQIERLLIGGNLISTLPPQVAEGLNKLKILDLTPTSWFLESYFMPPIACSIQKIPVKLFAQLEQIILTPEQKKRLFSGSTSSKINIKDMEMFKQLKHRHSLFLGAQDDEEAVKALGTLIKEHRRFVREQGS